MKYKLTVNIQKAILEFEELLKNFTNQQQKKRAKLNNIKQKLENVIYIIKNKNK